MTRQLDQSLVESAVDLLARAVPLEKISAAKFAAHVLLDPNFDPAGVPVVVDRDRVVGIAVAVARKRPINDADAERGFITLLAVADDSRRKGVGAALLSASETYLRSRGRKVVLVSPYAPYYFTPGIDVAAYPIAVEMFKRRGYAEINRPLSMRTDLTSLRPPEFVENHRQKLLADGVVVKLFAPNLSRGILEFTESEFGTDWTDVYRSAMTQILRGEPAERILAACDGPRVLGVSHFDRERFGPIGVKASERHRGIGQVLMYATLTAQQKIGHKTAFFLWSEDTTARRLYDGAGFREVRRFSILKKSLD